MARSNTFALPYTGAKAKGVRRPAYGLNTLDLAAIDLEFSDYGRDSDFPRGWWIMPGLVLELALVIWAVARVV